MKLIFLLFYLFVITPVFGAIVSDFTNVCGNQGMKNLYAVFSVDTITCNAGYFLPANTDGCVICSENYYCVGGTYTFNETDAQGITECPDDLPSVAGASSVEQCANAYICNSGYYLPANSVQCTICPANSYCVGGSYTFDENTPQGIVSCTSGLYAPVGMWESAQCGRILHIGDNVVYLRSVKKTSPSLHVKVEDTIFYGNMTTSDVVMNSGTDKKLKLQYDGQTYSVYDDTVVP
mgnify:FL=1